MIQELGGFYPLGVIPYCLVIRGLIECQPYLILGKSITFCIETSDTPKFLGAQWEKPYIKIEFSLYFLKPHDNNISGLYCPSLNCVILFSNYYYIITFYVFIRLLIFPRCPLFLNPMLSFLLALRF